MSVEVGKSTRKRRPTGLERWTSPRALGAALLGLGSVGLLLVVAAPGDVIDQIREMNPACVLGAIALELGSCVSYVIVFRRFFPEPPPAVSRRITWIAMGAGAVLPGGNLSSAAATGWLLRKHEIGTRPLLTRCAALLCLLTAFGFVVNGLAGVLLLAGVSDGPHDLLHAGGPILVSIAVLSLARCWPWGPGGWATLRPAPFARSPPGSRTPGRRWGRRTGGCSARRGFSAWTWQPYGRRARRPATQSAFSR
jgi:uncharacterized membrane protein YbhN (UPF0104 family)